MDSTEQKIKELGYKVQNLDERFRAHKHAGFDQTNQIFSFGTYTPTLTHTTNVGASTAYSMLYLRVGDIVFVSGRVDIDADAAGDTSLGMSLPIGSRFALDGDCSGVFNQYGSAAEQGVVYANTTSYIANINYYAVSTSNQAGRVFFMYKIIV